MKSINIIDISIVLTYLGICLALGFKKFGKIKTLREYTFGGRPFATAVLISTTFATIVGTKTVVGNVGHSYKFGITYAVTLFFAPVGWFIVARLLAKNIDLFHQKKFLTLSDIMEHWYGKWGRHITSLGTVMLTLGVVAAGSIATGKLGLHFFGIPEYMGMGVALAVVTVYSTIGGFSAVAFTDVFQFSIFFIAIPVACAIGYHNIGGYKNILQALPESHFTLNLKDLGLFISLSVLSFMPAMDSPYIQRALIATNKHQLQRVFNFTGFLLIPLFVMIILIGFMVYTENPNLELDTVLFYYIERYLPVGVIGLMIAGLLAIIMSTQDSFLNTTSTIISEICKHICPNLRAEQELVIARFACVVVSLSSLVLVHAKADIVSLAGFIYNFCAPLIGAPLILALMGIRIKKELFVIIPTITIIFQLIARQITGDFNIKTATIGVVTAVITTLIVSRIKIVQEQ